MPSWFSQSVERHIPLSILSVRTTRKVFALAAILWATFSPAWSQGSHYARQNALIQSEFSAESAYFTPGEELLSKPRIVRLNQLVLNDTMYQLAKKRLSLHYSLVAPLVERLANRNGPDMDRWTAAQQLGDLEREATLAVPALLQAFQGDPDITVRTYAAIALCQIDPRSVVEQLVRGLDSENDDTRQLCGAVLRKQGVSVIPLLKKALNCPDPNLKRLSCRALGEIGSPAKGALVLLRHVAQEDDRDLVFSAAANDAIAKIEAAPPKIGKYEPTPGQLAAVSGWEAE